MASVKTSKPTKKDKETIFPRGRRKRCPRGYKIDGKNCVYNEKSSHWKKWTVSPSRRKIQVYQLLNVLEQKGLLEQKGNLVDTLQWKLGIEDYSEAQELVVALHRLD